MSRVVITIETDNSAFTNEEDDSDRDAECLEEECARILHALANRFMRHDVGEHVLLYDYNGNHVGACKVIR
jgi:glycogen debranching enzyme